MSYLDESKCRCAADVAGSLDPEIRQRTYSRDVLYNLVNANPALGANLAYRCGIGDH
jgi:hypothetical protein